MKKRILFVADSVKRKTGYATVVRNILKNLAENEEYEIAQLGFADIPIPVDLPIAYYSQTKNHNQCCNKGPVIEYTPKGEQTIKYLTPSEDNSTLKEHQNQITCIKGEPHMPDHYGFDSIYFVIQHFKPDIVIPVNDIWGLFNINHLRNRTCFKFVPYLAIDSDCLFPMLKSPEGRPGLPDIDTIKTIGTMDKCIVFTDWAKEVINKTCRIVTSGKELQNIITIPHGVDTNTWKRLPDEQIKAARKKYFGIEDNTFLVGSVARNQPRKRLDGLFMMLRKFIDTYETKGRKVKCYFHCSLQDSIGWDLQWLSAWYGLVDRVIFDRNLQPGIGPTETQLNEIVNCFDVHVSLTNSEGWHLPALETAAAGVPNIITNYSAHADWGKDTLLFCKIGAYEHEPRTGLIKAIADTNHAAHQLNLLYSSKKMCQEYSKKGIRLGEKLDWKNVCKIWKEIIDDIDVSELKEDRYSNPDILPAKNEQQNNDMSLQHFPE